MYAITYELANIWNNACLCVISLIIQHYSAPVVLLLFFVRVRMAVSHNMVINNINKGLWKTVTSFCYNQPSVANSNSNCSQHNITTLPGLSNMCPKNPLALLSLVATICHCHDNSWWLMTYTCLGGVHYEFYHISSYSSSFTSYTPALCRFKHSFNVVWELC